MTERYQFEKHIIATKSDTIITRNKECNFIQINTWSKRVSGKNCNVVQLQKSDNGGTYDKLKRGLLKFNVLLCNVSYWRLIITQKLINWQLCWISMISCEIQNKNTCITTNVCIIFKMCSIFNIWHPAFDF